MYVIFAIKIKIKCTIKYYVEKKKCLRYIDIKVKI